MKFSILLIDLILFLSIFIPYYLFIWAGKKAGKKKIETFKGIAKSQKLLPNIEECWGDQFIGIDSRENSLLYIQLRDKEALTKIICLDRVKECQLIDKYHRIMKGNKKEEVLGYLGLELVLSGPGQPKEVLTFYEAGGGYEQDYEKARGEKWLSLIKEHLQHPPKPVSVAA